MRPDSSIWRCHDHPPAVARRSAVLPRRFRQRRAAHRHAHHRQQRQSLVRHHPVSRPRPTAVARFAFPAHDRRPRRQHGAHRSLRAGHRRHPADGPARRHRQDIDRSHPQRRIRDGEPAVRHPQHLRLRLLPHGRGDLYHHRPTGRQQTRIGQRVEHRPHLAEGKQRRRLRHEGIATHQLGHQYAAAKQTADGAVRFDSRARVHARRIEHALRRMAGQRLRHRRRSHVADGQLHVLSGAAGQSRRP